MQNIKKHEFRQNGAVTTLRYLLALIGILFLVQTTSLGSPTWAVALAIFAGIFFSNKFLKKNITLKSTILIHTAIFFIIHLLFWTASFFISSQYDLYLDILNTQWIFLFFLYVLVFSENHLFWKKSYILGLEVVFLGFILITLLSGHRNYKVDIPNTISSLTWKIPLLQSYGAEPQQLLVGIGLIFGLISLFYIILSNNRRLLNDQSTLDQTGKKQRLGEVLLGLMVVIGLFFTSKTILSSYEKELSQVMNGVGPSSDLKDGESNLGFNKASNPSRQPAAFVRLQNSYEANPWKPMLYFREGALSTYNGKEIVKSGTEFDGDAPVLRPGEPFRAELLAGEDNRDKLLQAVYVLSDKVTPFGIDAPIQFTPIKNPNPKRFRYAYTVLSMALTEPLDSLVGLEVGDANWSKETWEHYLRAPASNDLTESKLALPSPFVEEPVLSLNSGEDLRYKALSDQLTASIEDPIKKAFSVIEYLSKESIYVLEPGHTLGSNGDPVAPYLFPDKKRGYCVHFAHAVTYLLRLAGIPARIGTGFLVDLQYAKGGDILVQMGDRHAWPEIYIRDRGWIVFDVTPAQAENQEVPIPDENLLEELMSEVDPIEELSEPVPLTESEKNQKSPIESLINSPIWAYFKYLLPFILLSFILAKITLRHGWRFSKDPKKIIRRAYISLASTYEDLGHLRFYGETREDYALRLYKEKGIDFLTLTKLAVKNSYLELDSKISAKDINSQLQLGKSTFKKKITHYVLYLISYLNPVSLPYLKKYFNRVAKLSLFLPLFLCFSFQNAEAIPGNQTLDQNLDFLNSGTADSEKSAEMLLVEAIELLREGKSIDARAKLEQALHKDPNDHRPYLFLGQYYLTEVGHFKLAYRYLKQARQIFEKNSSRDFNSIYDLGFQNQHALILYLESEAALNLDFYEESLQILNEYGKLYQSEWYPGQKAWVLMKLKRIKEAIEVARTGLLEGADPKRTWNILGILFSVSDERELSIQAFAKAIRYELALGGYPQVATPLNNVGEVYRELFRDAFAESAWQKALRLPDGCEHILPSVNLSILYTDQLRLFQASQVLSDFQACYALKPERKDSEHRTILALARAKLSLLSNEVKKAKELAEIAADDQQWFGKIGTNENDVKLAAWITLAQIKKLEAESLRDEVTDSSFKTFFNYIKAYTSEIYSWWLNRKAKIFAVKELENFEDLLIRHTDTMITYPLLGTMLNEFSYSALKARLDSLRKEDDREGAHNYYNFYEAKKLIERGNESEARLILNQVLERLPEHERLLKAEILASLIISELNEAFFFNRTKVILKNLNFINSLYELLPAHLRFYNIPLPVNLEVDPRLDPEFKEIKDDLTKRRFLLNPTEATNYRINIVKGDQDNAFIHLYNKQTNRRISGVEIKDKKEISKKVNEFISHAFSHHSDPKGLNLPEIPFLK